MKIYDGKSHRLRTTSYISARSQRFDHLRERAKTAVVLTVAAAAFVAAYVVMFVGVYRWSP